MTHLPRESRTHVFSFEKVYARQVQGGAASRQGWDVRKSRASLAVEIEAKDLVLRLFLWGLSPFILVLLRQWIAEVRPGGNIRTCLGYCSIRYF